MNIKENKYANRDWAAAVVLCAAVGVLANMSTGLQAVWLGVLLLLGRALMKRALKKVVAQGG